MNEWQPETARGGLVTSARRHIRKKLRAELSWPQKVEAGLRSLSQPQSRPLRLGVVVYFAALFLIAVGLAAWEPSVLPNLRPLQGDGMSVLWQVQAALVAVALPFLFVLMPLIRNDEMAVTRTAQLLMADTLINPILLFSLAGVVWMSFAALWLDRDSAKWLSVLFVFLPTVLGIAFAYLRSARIISDRAYVRRASVPLLLNLVDRSVVEQAAIEYANGALVGLLSAELFESSPWMPSGNWIIVEANRSGVVSDVDGARLLASIRRLPPAEPMATTQPDPEAAPTDVAAPGDRRGHLITLIGDRVLKGSSLLALREESFGPLDRASLATQLGDCFSIDDAQ